MSNEDVVRRYVEATVAGDLEGQAALRHGDWRTHWPQSGESVMDEASYDQIIRNYPGGSPTSRITRVAGTEDRYVATPSGTLARVGGEGDYRVGEREGTYPVGVTYLCVELMDL